MEKIKGYQYDLRIVGLWGKNRKVKDEYVDFVEFSEHALSERALTAIAIEKVSSLKAKPGLRWYVSVYDAAKDDVCVSVYITLAANTVVASGIVND